MNKLSNLTKLKILFFLKFCAEAMFLPFLAIYFKDLGFNAKTIGLFLAIPPIVGICLSPIYSAICKNVKVTKNIYTVITILNAICMFLFFKLTSYYALLVVIILYNIFQANNFGLLEAFASVCSNHEHTDYSKVRVFGSIAYVFGLPLSGFITKFSSFFLASMLALVFTILSAVFSFILPITLDKEKHQKRDVKALITNKEFILFAIFYTIFLGTMNVGDDFYGTYMESTKGFTYDTYSYVWASFIVVECFVIIFLYRFKKKFKFKHLYTIAIFCAIIRFFTNAYGGALPIVITLGLTKGITMGIQAFLWGQFIIHITGKHNGGLAIIISTFVINIYQALLKIGLGHVIDATSYYVFYLILAYMLILSFVFFIIVYKNNEYISMKDQKKKKKQVKVQELNDTDNEVINNTLESENNTIDSKEKRLNEVKSI